MKWWRRAKCDGLEKTRLAYLTSPEGRPVLNLQFENGGFFRIEISRGQLEGIVLSGMKNLLEKKK